MKITKLVWSAITFIPMALIAFCKGPQNGSAWMGSIAKNRSGDTLNTSFSHRDVEVYRGFHFGWGLIYAAASLAIMLLTFHAVATVVLALFISEPSMSNGTSSEAIIFTDTETGVQYILIGDTATPRLNANGCLMIEEQ